MAFRIQENFTELSNTELEDSKNTNPNFDQLMEIKNTNPSKLPKIKKLYFVHSKILLTCSYFKDIIFNLKAGSQSPMPLQIQNSDSIFFPILDLNWSKPATLTILRFFYTREVSADIYNTEVLNEVCQIAGQLQNEDLDFALTHLKRKSLVQKQEKMNIFKVPSLNKKHKKRSKDGTFSSEKESNSMTDDSSMVDADNPKNPFAPKNKNTNKKNEKPALPAKNKSKNPFATGDEAGAEDAKAQHPEKFAGSTSKFFTQSWVDKCGTVIRSDSEESSASKETSEKSTPVKKNNSSRRF